MNSTQISVIGLGNPFRCDDSAGIHIVEHIKTRISPQIALFTQIQDEFQLIEIWKNTRKAILVDAVIMGNPPGTPIRLDCISLEKTKQSRISIHCASQYSTHGFNLLDIISLARLIQSLPSQLILFGIEASKINYGTQCSLAVQCSIPIVSEWIISELKQSATD